VLRSHEVWEAHGGSDVRENAHPGGLEQSGRSGIVDRPQSGALAFARSGGV